MNINETVINREVQAILSSGAKPVFFEWMVQIHANGKVIVPMLVMNVEKIGDYLRKYSDSHTVEVLLMQGDYTQDILPFKSNLEITLRRKPLSEKVNPQEDIYLPTDSFRYRATLYDNSSPLLEGNLANLKDKETQNRSNTMEISFHLTEPVLEQIRMQTYGDILRDITPVDAVRWILTKYTVTDVKDRASTVKGVTVAPNFNTIKRNHISIPHLTPIINIPDFIHNNAGGVYATGFGFYLQRQFWYVYSPYDLKAYDKSRKTLTILNIPANRMPSPERSYRETPTQLFVLATGDAKHYDNSEQQQLNQGNGVRFMDAGKAFEDWGVVQDNKLIVKRSDNVTEALIEKRDTGLNFIKQTASKFTVNSAREFSLLAARSGAFIEYVWENANPDLLYPAMPVRVMFVQNNQAMQLYGCLVGTHVFSISDTKGMVNKKYSNKVILRVFIERQLPEDV